MNTVARVHTLEEHAPSFRLAKAERRVVSNECHIRKTGVYQRLRRKKELFSRSVSPETKKVLPSASTLSRVIEMNFNSFWGAKAGQNAPVLQPFRGSPGSNSDRG